jgi:hypothetical protein
MLHSIGSGFVSADLAAPTQRANGSNLTAPSTMTKRTLRARLAVASDSIKAAAGSSQIRFRAHWIAFSSGLLLIAMATWLAYLAARQYQPPNRTSTPAISFVAPLIPLFGRGWIVDMSVHQPSGNLCSGEAEIAVVIQGSREYWDDNPSGLRGRSTFALGIAGMRVRRPRAYLLRSPNDVEALRTQEDGSIDVISRPVVSNETDGRIGALTVSVDDWGQRRNPLAFIFDTPDLVARRDLASCWMSVPALTGPQSQLAATFGEVLLHLPAAPSAQQAVEGHLNPRPWVSAGRTTLVDATGDSPISTEPDPATATSAGQVWTCRSSGLPRNLRGNDQLFLTNSGALIKHRGEQAGAAPQISDFEAVAAAHDCSAIAAVTTGGLVLPPSLVGFIAGILLTLGGALIVVPFVTDPPKRQAADQSPST